VEGRGVRGGLLATLGWTVIEGDNKDFHLFGSSLLNIAIFASLFILFGVVVVPLFDWISRWLPAPSFRRRLVLLWLPTSYSLAMLGSLAAHGFGLFLGVQMGMAAGFGFGEEGNTREFLRGLSIYLLLIPSISSTLLTRRVGEVHRLSDLRQRPGVLAVPLAVLTPPLVTGGVLITLAIIQISTAAQ